MDTPLDHPIWNALTTRHRHFAIRGGLAARYPSDVSPLAALSEQSPAALSDMAAIVSPGGVVAIAGLAGLEIAPDLWVMNGEPLPLLQMVCDAPLAPPAVDVRTLGQADVPEMLRLVDVAQPGPFAQRTIELGRYVGVFRGARLIAMAGERLALEGATEVSAVCTDPSFRGRGLGEQLVRTIGVEIQRVGRRPFLHVLADNLPAIALYRKLGFVERGVRPLSVLQRL